MRMYSKGSKDRRNKCTQCQKLRIKLISNYAFLIVIDYIFRRYFEFETNTVTDLLFLPTVITFTVAVLAFIGKNKNFIE